MSETLYKVLGYNGQPCNGGSGIWYLPNGDKPGNWMPKIEGELIPCCNGYHVCRIDQLIHWLGPKIYEVEVRGEQIDNGDKLVVEQARLSRGCVHWNEFTSCMFVADCAERVLHIFEDKYPDNDRLRIAIQAARDYAYGLIERDTLSAAADAAKATAGVASWAAERAAERAAAKAAAWVAWAVTGTATWSAACVAWAMWAAADTAKAVAESQWQTEFLKAILNGECEDRW